MNVRFTSTLHFIPYENVYNQEFQKTDTHRHTCIHGINSQFIICTIIIVRDVIFEPLIDMIFRLMYHVFPLQ